MFIRLKNTSGSEINVNMNQVFSFSPSEAGSVLIFTNGSSVVVQESNRMIRHAVSKAASASAPEAEAPAAA